MKGSVGTQSSLPDLLEIHAVLVEGGRGSHLTPGALRRTQNWIGPAGGTLSEAAFVPPPPAEVPAALAGLERFLHADDEMPLLLRIGLAHAQFERTEASGSGSSRATRMRDRPTARSCRLGRREVEA